MLVSSEANAAQSRVAGEAVRFFDDIGCLAADAASRAEGTTRYVRLASGDWTAADPGWFAFSSGTRTPMDYGVLAFSSREEAARADRDRQPRSWADVIAHAEAR